MTENLNSNFVVGTKQTIKAINKNLVKACFIAKDADERIINNIISLCNQKNIEVIYVNSMDELGKRFKITVGSATAVELIE